MQVSTYLLNAISKFGMLKLGWSILLSQSIDQCKIGIQAQMVLLDELVISHLDRVLKPSEGFLLSIIPTHTRSVEWPGSNIRCQEMLFLLFIIIMCNNSVGWPQGDCEGLAVGSG